MLVLVSHVYITTLTSSRVMALSSDGRLGVRLANNVELARAAELARAVECMPTRNEDVSNYSHTLSIYTLFVPHSSVNYDATLPFVTSLREPGQSDEKVQRQIYKRRARTARTDYTHVKWAQQSVSSYIAHTDNRVLSYMAYTTLLLH